MFNVMEMMYNFSTNQWFHYTKPGFLIENFLIFTKLLKFHQ